MKSLFRKRDWKVFGLVLALSWVVWSFSACIVNVPDLLCMPCKGDCIEEDTNLTCREGVCVPKDNPDPTLCKKEEAQEGAVEKTEHSPEESVVVEEGVQPEETISPEEAVTPEDGGLEREPEQTSDDPNAIAITSINGTGSELPIAYGTSTKPADAREASKRFQDSWNVAGKNLDRVQEWHLKNLQTNQAFVLASDNKGSDMISLKLPSNLVAGLFLLVGLIGGQTVVQAQVFVLQGDSRFSEEDATKLQALLAKIQPKGNSLEITADTISLKPATSGQKVTLDLSSNATLRAGNNTLDFSGDALTITAKTFSVLAETRTEIITPDFSAKNTANDVSLQLDAANREIRLSAANAGDAATFTLKHESLSGNPATHPSATFRNLNLHVQNGHSTLSTESTNGRGNLILGYNKPRATPITNSRDGSHNLIIGDEHYYTKYAGLVVGFRNAILGNYSSVSGGQGNSARGDYSSVSGGQSNQAHGAHSSVAGGQGNQAGDATNGPPNSHGHVCGGNDLTATRQHGVACLHSP